MRLLCVALIASLVPPAWIAWAGGADVDVLGWRVELYRSFGPGLGLFGLLWLVSLPDARGRAGRALRGAALLAFAVAVFASWSNGFETEWLRINRADRPSQIGALFVLLAFGLGGARLAMRRGLAMGTTGIFLGLLALGLVRMADRTDLERRIAAADAQGTGPDVIFLLIDTLRADALGSYGASPSPSPFLDELAERSVVFERALAQAHWTVPSVSSLLSGLHPSSFFAGRQRDVSGGIPQLPAGLPWLPEQLRSAGYHTAAFAKNPYLQVGSGFERGFDVFEFLRGDTAEGESAGELVNAVLLWADAMAEHRARGGAGSFFLYAHFMEPHVEYRPPAAFWPEGDYDGPIDGGVRSLRRTGEQPGGPRPDDIARVRALYRAEVAYLDSELRRLHGRLVDLGLWNEETIFVLVADHGEQFFEHGAFQHKDVFWENLHVPILLRAPGIAPQRVAEPVALLDLGATLLGLAGAEATEPSEGRSLIPRLRGGPPQRKFVMSEHIGRQRDTIRVTGPDGALALGEAEQWFEDADGRVLDLADVPADAQPTVAALSRELDRFRSRETPSLGASKTGVRTLAPDADTEQRLRALGYLD